jgi:hypothetical protein
LDSLLHEWWPEIVDVMTDVEDYLVKVKVDNVEVALKWS